MSSPENSFKPVAEKNNELSKEIFEKWEREKSVGLPWALQKGKEMGIPKENLDKYTQEFIAQEKDLWLVFRLRKNLKIGTDEEIKKAGIEAYQYLFSKKEFSSASVVAKEIFGEESEEWKIARTKFEQETKDVEEEKDNENEERDAVSIPLEATFADLRKAMENFDLESLHFDEELIDNYDDQLAEKVQDLLDDTDSEEAEKTKVLDLFLNYHQIDRNDLSKEELDEFISEMEVYLPIKFIR